MPLSNLKLVIVHHRLVHRRCPCQVKFPAWRQLKFDGYLYALAGDAALSSDEFLERLDAAGGT